MPWRPKSATPKPKRSSTWKSDSRYTSRRWRAIAKAQLQASPLCVLCAEGGIVTAATVADHITPHRGEAEAFWFGALQSLCASHHGTKSAGERKGIHCTTPPTGGTRI
jgi:hypothetical protein